MPDLYICEQGATLNKSGDTLHVRKAGVTYLEIETKQIETIQLFGNIQITTQVIRELLFQGIELAYYTEDGRLYGQLTPPHVKNVELRYLQYKLSEDESFKTEIAKEVLVWKMQGGIDFLIDSQKNHPDLNLLENIAELKIQRESLWDAEDIPGILGKEGSFAKKYYESFGKLFKTEGIFKGRSKRPPLDPTNAVLSFLYTLMTNKISSYVDGVGLDPYIGFLHSLEYGRVSLGCDLVEPFRSIFCDRLCVKIFNQKMLDPVRDFENRDGGVYLRKDSIKNFLKIFSEELYKDKDYGFIKGKFQSAMIHMNQWIKKSIEQKTVRKISE